MKTPIYAAALSLFVSSAFAHSQLTASTPSDKASVANAPQELVLRFSEPVRLTALVVTRAGDLRHALEALSKERQKDFNVASPGLTNGQYTVNWRALSDDAHVMTGEFTFTVGVPAGPGAAHDAHAASHAEHGGHAAQHEQH